MAVEEPAEIGKRKARGIWYKNGGKMKEASAASLEVYSWSTVFDVTL